MLHYQPHNLYEPNLKGSDWNLLWNKVQ